MSDHYPSIPANWLALLEGTGRIKDSGLMRFLGEVSLQYGDYVDPYKAPEQTPNMSRQVLALAVITYDKLTPSSCGGPCVRKNKQNKS